MGPIVPFLSDSPTQLDATVRQIAAAGATSVTPIVLHLRTGAREWFFRWLAEQHPGLVPRYRGLYGRGAYAPKAYQERIAGHVQELASRYRVGRGRSRAGPLRGRRANPADPASPATPANQASPAAPANQASPASPAAGEPPQAPDGRPPVQLALL
jgi:DNA repair photolyase